MSRAKYHSVVSIYRLSLSLNNRKTSIMAIILLMKSLIDLNF
jgi:hypothetical protein